MAKLLPEVKTNAAQQLCRPPVAIFAVVNTGKRGLQADDTHYLLTVLRVVDIGYAHSVLF